MTICRRDAACVRQFAPRLISALLVLTTLGACGASRYSAEPTHAWVVDKTTGKPIEGVVVVAYWELRWGFEGGSVLDMKILEASTDSQGHFSIPGWGPESIPRAAGFGARMRNNDPRLFFFHPGYSYKGLQNSDLRVSNEALDLPVRKSEHTGKRIELTALRADDFRGRERSLSEYLMNLSVLDRQSHPAPDKLPKFCDAMKAALNSFHEDLSRTSASVPAALYAELRTNVPPPKAVCIPSVKR
jgi:hypothetical protein